MKKEKKDCIQYYLDNIESEEYKKYKSQKLLEQNKNQEAQTDYDDEPVITSISIYDTLNNDGVTHLLKRIYSLPKIKYKVDCSYKKPCMTKKYDYVHLQYSEKSYESFAEIELIKDKYIKCIKITCTQINNYYSFFEYHFTFRSFLNEELYNRFIIDNIRNLGRKDFMVWYKLGKDKNYSILEQMNYELFSTICQHYVTSVLYSKHGKSSQLVNMQYRMRNAPIHIEDMDPNVEGKIYYNKKSNYLIISDYEGVNLYLFAGGQNIPRFRMCKYVFRYGNEFYNYFFGYRELKIYEREFSKFISGRKKPAYNTEFTEILTKTYSIKSPILIDNGAFNKEFEKEWDFYVGNSKKNFIEYTQQHFIDYNQIYDQIYSYMKLLSDMNYTKSNFRISVVAIIISIMAILVSVIVA